MKKGKKVAFIVAGVMVALGALITVVGLSKGSFDFEKIFSEGEVVEKTYVIQEKVSSIKVEKTNGASIEIVPATDGIAKIELREPKNYEFIIKEDNGLLSLSSEAKNTWRMFSSPKAIIYLPAEEYKDLSVESSSGSVKIADGFTFDTANVACSSGSVEFKSNVNGSLKIKVTSGSMTLDGVKANDVTVESTSGGTTLESVEAVENIKVKGSSGSISAGNVTCKDLTIENTSGSITANTVSAAGDISLKNSSGSIKIIDTKAVNLKAENTSGIIQMENTLIDEKLNLENTSGGIRITASDAKEINMKSSSGSINAQLLTNKDFEASATSGSVKLPDVTTGKNGTCLAKTTSGGIKITLAE